MTGTDLNFWLSNIVHDLFNLSDANLPSLLLRLFLLIIGLRLG